MGGCTTGRPGVFIGLAARNDLEGKKEALRRLTGNPPGPLDRLINAIPAEPPAPNDAEQWSVRWPMTTS